MSIDERDAATTASHLDSALTRYLERRGIALPVITTGEKIIEEANELVDAIAEQDPTHIRAEIGDVAIVLAVIARQFDTSVEACIAEKTEADAGRG